MLTKICLVIFLCCLWLPAIAANRFIVKYRLNKDQIAFLSSHRSRDVDEKKAKMLIRKQMMQPLSQEKIEALSKAAGVQAKDIIALATGAHVIILNKQLTQKETDQFIYHVQQDNSVEYIVEDRLLSAASGDGNSLNPRLANSLRKDS